MPRSAEVISHWHHTLENFNTSALDFYRSVEGSLSARQAPNVRIERVDWSESGILSAKREYLRISYGRFSFDLCAAPFGKDYFFSWWLVKRQPDAALLYGCLGLMAIPILLLSLIQMAGFIGGLIAFMFALALGFAVMVNSARSGSGIVEDADAGHPRCRCSLHALLAASHVLLDGLPRRLRGVRASDCARTPRSTAHRSEPSAAVA